MRPPAVDGPIERRTRASDIALTRRHHIDDPPRRRVRGDLCIASGARPPTAAAGASTRPRSHEYGGPAAPLRAFAPSGQLAAMISQPKKVQSAHVGSCDAASSDRCAISLAPVMNAKWT